MTAPATQLARQPADTMFHTTIESPVGPLLLAGTETTLHFVSFCTSRRAVRPKSGWRRANEPFKQTRRQLAAYFAQELKTFDLPLAVNGSDFQLSVWRHLQTIPYGETISYGELARRIGKPDAARAVGLANGQNPIPIIIPCHRVIGSGGSLTGFGGGLPIKQKLLRLENPQADLF